LFGSMSLQEPMTTIILSLATILLIEAFDPVIASVFEERLGHIDLFGGKSDGS